MQNILKLSLLMGLLCSLNVFASSDVEKQIVSDGGADFKETMSKHGQEINGLYDAVGENRHAFCPGWFGDECYKKRRDRTQELKDSIEQRVNTIHESGELPSSCNVLWFVVDSWRRKPCDLNSWDRAVGRCVEQVVETKKKRDIELKEAVQREVQRVLAEQAATIKVPLAE